jgi:hypothetical protein
MPETTDPPAGPVAPAPADPVTPSPKSRKSARTWVIATSVIFGCLIVGIAIIVASVPLTPQYDGLSPRQAVQEWVNAGGYDHMTDIDDHIGQLKRAQTTPEVRQACVDLYGAADKANSYGHIPDIDTQGYWSSTLAFIESAANKCIHGIDGNTVYSGTDATSDGKHITDEMTRFNSRMRQVLYGAAPIDTVRRGWVHTNNGVINDVLTVPVPAVIKEGANYYVNIPGSNGSPQRVQFSPGSAGLDYVEVTGGLEEGQPILLPAPPR